MTSRCWLSRILTSSVLCAALWLPSGCGDSTEKGVPSPDGGLPLGMDAGPVATAMDGAVGETGMGPLPGNMDSAGAQDSASATARDTIAGKDSGSGTETALETGTETGSDVSIGTTDSRTVADGPIGTTDGRTESDGPIGTPTDDARDTPSTVSDDAGVTVDDGLSCTDDVCTSEGCTHTLQKGWCLIAGICRADGALNPQSPCQYCDVLFATDAWRNKTDGTTCNDGNLCTQNDVCQAGQCKGPDPLSCAAAAVCHSAETCDPLVGCVDKVLPSGTACEHESGAPAHCNDNGKCIKDTCTCSGSAICCANDCTAGPAAAGTACEDDGLACTNNVCQTDGNCIHTVVPNTCLIGAQCYAAGEENGIGPTAHCHVCDPSASQTAWTPTNKPEDSCNGIDDDCDGQIDEWPAPDEFEPNDYSAPSPVGTIPSLDTVVSPSDVGVTSLHSNVDNDYFSWTVATNDVGLRSTYYWMCRIEGLLEQQRVLLVLHLSGSSAHPSISDSLGNKEYFVLELRWQVTPPPELTLVAGVLPLPDSGITSCPNSYTLLCKLKEYPTWTTRLSGP